jgi:general secretion pathway protein D
LHVLGYAAVPAGDIVKIIPLRDAGRESVKVIGNNSTVSGDSIVVQIIPLKYISAIQLVPILNPLIPSWANVSAVTTANSIIISGTASVVQRVNNIIARVDTPAANGVDVISLQYASSEDVAKELDKLIQASRAYGDTVSAAISADDRSNSILLSGNQATRLRLKVLISQLDQAGSNGLGDTQVIHLHYIQVQDILPILRGIAHQNPGSIGSSAGTPINSGSNSSSSYGSNSSLDSGDNGFTNQVQSISNAELNSGAVSGDGTKQQTVITGDVTNNALIITAPNAMMNKLKNVIARLDVRPEEVLVQGVIAEVDASKAQSLGIQWGSQALSGADSSGNSVLGPTSAFAATGGMGVCFITDGSLRGVAQLLGSDSGSNILSTPSITVLNNGHADIEVGKTFSELTGNYQPSGNSNSNPFQQFSDKSVGLALRVTPQITGDDSIRLAIDQSNSSIINDSDSTNSSSNSINPNPSTNQEKISTSVLVNNGQILVLGGLMSAQKEKVTTKVPFLGDIPLLGWAFKHTEDRNVKKDLLIFLRPIVISNPEQASELSKKRYEFMRDRQILNANGQGQFTADSVLMSPGGVKLPVPFAQSKN